MFVKILENEIWKFGGNLPLATLAVKGLITRTLEKQAPDLNAVKFFKSSRKASCRNNPAAALYRETDLSNGYVSNLVSRLEASRGTSGEYRVPWERGFYVETVVFLAECFLAYKEMVYLRFLM